MYSEIRQPLLKKPLINSFSGLLRPKVKRVISKTVRKTPPFRKSPHVQTGTKTSISYLIPLIFHNWRPRHRPRLELCSFGIICELQKSLNGNLSGVFVIYCQKGISA